MRSFTLLSAVGALLCASWPSALIAQRAAIPPASPPVGTVSPGAVGAPAPTAAPIGGLRTQPIPPAGARGPRGTGVYPLRGGSRLGGVVPLMVADAPVVSSGIVITSDPTRYNAGWMPTTQPPQWVRDTTVEPVQAWRDLIVTDVVCNQAATCLERRQRIRARWIATCRCYAFADGWNRIWRVE